MDDPDTVPGYAYDIYDRCHDEGWAAYKNGQSITDNPYERETFEWEAWREGYER